MSLEPATLESTTLSQSHHPPCEINVLNQYGLKPSACPAMGAGKAPERLWYIWTGFIEPLLFAYAINRGSYIHEYSCIIEFIKQLLGKWIKFKACQAFYGFWAID